MHVNIPLGRSIRCQQCTACLREDCGQCKFCIDKPKFGGKGVKKQSCTKRRCLNTKSASHNPALNLATNATTHLTDVTKTLGKMNPIIMWTTHQHLNTNLYIHMYIGLRSAYRSCTANPTGTGTIFVLACNW